MDINLSHNSDSFTYGPKGEYRFASLPDVPTGNFELYLQSFGQSTSRRLRQRTRFSPRISFAPPVA